MEHYEADIENAVLPNFINEKIHSVEWGEWVGPFVETALAGVKINGRPYVLIESDYDDLPKSDASDDIGSYLSAFGLTKEQVDTLGFMPTKLLRLLKKSSLGLSCVSQLEVEDGRVVDYMLSSE